MTIDRSERPLRHVAWLGLAVLPCVVVGAALGLWLATALEIPAAIGQVVGFVVGYLVSRTMLRRFFAQRL